MKLLSVVFWGISKLFIHVPGMLRPLNMLNYTEFDLVNAKLEYLGELSIIKCLKHTGLWIKSFYVS